MQGSQNRPQYQLLIGLVKERAAHYLLATLALALASLLAFLVPWVGKLVIDHLLAEPGPDAEPASELTRQILALAGGQSYLADNLWLPALAVVALTALSGLFMFIKDYLGAKACELSVERLRNRLYWHLHRLPAAWHAKADSGDLLQRCTSDIDTLREFLTMQVMNIGRTAIMVIIVLPLMLALDVTMTLLALVLVPPVLWFAFRFFGQVRDLFQQVDEAEAGLTTVVQENLTGIRVVRAFARQQFEIEKFEQKNAGYREKNLQLLALLARFWSISDLLCLSQMGIVLAAGGYLASLGSISLGTYFTFLTYTGMLIWPIRELGKELSEAGKATVAIHRIQQVLDGAEEQATVDPLPLPQRLRGEIEFRNISFSYPGNSQQPVLKNFSCHIQPGETIAIVGPTGAGKSTLLQLLLRLYDYDSSQGQILLDGQPLHRLDRQALRRQIGTALQEPFLFSRSLRQNIKFADNQASDECMIGATTASAVHNTIQSFSEGYETEIGERGISLSGGQRQRIALSRTLLSDPPLLILDDTLSAVDSATEQKIVDALRQRHGRQTRLVITHRISVCQQADRILVLRSGELAQQGSHQALLSEPGFYQQLWQIQSGQQQAFASAISDNYPGEVL